MNPYVDHFTQQIGKGIPGYKGMPFQKGRGLLTSLFTKTVYPLIKNTIKDIDPGQLVKLAGDVLSSPHTGSFIKTLQGGEGRKYKARRRIKKKSVAKKRCVKKRRLCVVKKKKRRKKSRTKKQQSAIKKKRVNRSSKKRKRTVKKRCLKKRISKKRTFYKKTLKRIKPKLLDALGN